jgi:putative tryptophan/tyrosine transport system substrate-binding protein
MQRRDFIILLGGAAAAWPIAARAQQPAMPVVGYLDGARPTNVDAFRKGLGEAGYAEGRNVAIEFRPAEGQYDKLPGLAAELVRRQVAVIAAATPVAALAAKAATTTIPIVFSLGSDPVKDGLVASLNRPGGNITGVTFFTNLLSSKRLELLHELASNSGVIAVLLNPDNANVELEQKETEVAAQALGLQLIIVQARTVGEIDGAFANLVQQRATALYVSGDAFFGSRSEQIAYMALRHGIPTSRSSREHVVAGGLMSYGANRVDSARQFGFYTGRILKGDKPADLPVQQPAKFELVLNLRTAKALGLAVPDKLLALADEVIE